MDNVAAERETPSAARWSRMRVWLDPATIGPRLQRAREVLRFAVSRAEAMRLPQVAGSLTFTTVLALVPLAAVALSIFAAFPMFGELRGALEKNVLREMLPAQYAAMLLRYINEFAAKAAGLTAFGLVFLGLTAMMMIATVERTLNELWHVRQQRRVAQRVLVYWALLTLGPLVIGGSVAATSFLISMSTGVVRQMPVVVRGVLGYLPLVVSGLAYAALYVLVPYRRVMWRDALIGGFAAAIAGELIKDGFAAYLKAGNVSSIYGAFAVVPLFLIWVWLSWLVFLFGAAIAATIPELRTTRFADEHRPGNDFVTAVAMLRALYAALGETRGERSTDELSRLTRTRLDDTERLLLELERLDYVRTMGGTRAGQWRLTCDPRTTTLRRAYERFAFDPSNSLLTRDRVGIGDWIAMRDEGDWLDRPLAGAVRA